MIFYELHTKLDNRFQKASSTLYFCALQLAIFIAFYNAFAAKIIRSISFSNRPRLIVFYLF